MSAADAGGPGQLPLADETLQQALQRPRTHELLGNGLAAMMRMHPQHRDECQRLLRVLALHMPRGDQQAAPAAEPAAGAPRQVDQVVLAGDPAEIGAQMVNRILRPAAECIGKRDGGDQALGFMMAVVSATLATVSMTWGPGIAAAMLASVGRVMREEMGKAPHSGSTH